MFENISTILQSDLDYLTRCNNAGLLHKATALGAEDVLIFVQQYQSTPSIVFYRNVPDTHRYIQVSVQEPPCMHSANYIGFANQSLLTKDGRFLILSWPTYNPDSERFAKGAVIVYDCTSPEFSIKKILLPPEKNLRTSNEKGKVVSLFSVEKFDVVYFGTDISTYVDLQGSSILVVSGLELKSTEKDAEPTELPCSIISTKYKLDEL